VTNNRQRGAYGLESGPSETTLCKFRFALAVRASPGRTLPAEAGLSGSLVLRFGGASLGKSGISIGCTGARARGLGEHGRVAKAAGFRTRPTDVAGPVAGAGSELVGFLVGVDGRE